MPYIYIGSPYSHPDDSIQHSRFEAVMRYVAWLNDKGAIPFSPILHCRPLALAHKLPHDAAFWSRYNATMLRTASCLHILNISGAKDSKGLWQEATWAENLHITMWLTEFDGDGYDIRETNLSKLASQLRGMDELL